MVVALSYPLEIFAVFIQSLKATDDFINGTKFDAYPTATFEFTSYVGGAGAAEWIEHQIVLICSELDDTVH